MSETILNSKYFKASIDHTLLYPGYEVEVNKCSFCQNESNYILNESESPGCIECLLKRKFSISKDTEIGMIENGGLYKVEFNYDFSSITDRLELNKSFEDFSETMNKIPLPIPKGFSKESLFDICHTPDVSCFQDISHPVHCTDFMVYIGRWEMEDFNLNSKDGDGKALFIQMLDDSEFDHLWEFTLEERREFKGNWSENYEFSNWGDGSCVYVFECLHCKFKRCTWDCD